LATMKPLLHSSTKTTATATKTGVPGWSRGAGGIGHQAACDLKGISADFLRRLRRFEV
jgi:hypothetical protein